ncbi:energy-coupling factor transporter transmembrane component T family protein [Peptococcus simiae]|uniref:energy-coupling factor transporter transmembrane component T family protein n=1 Tax=Peptococcus simiae TaxID=1643805 RepID=UPI0039815DBE
MAFDVTIGQYVEGDSILHRLDPRTKIVCILFFMIALFVVKTPPGFVLVFVGALAVLGLSEVPIRYYLKALKPLLFIIVFTGLMQVFLTPGDYIWSWRFLHISKEGLFMAFLMCTRLVLLVLITSVLTLTTTPMALTEAIETLLKPFRRIGVPAHELAMMMTIALRFIPTLMEETDKIMKAQTARGADFESGGILRRAKALLPILVPLFLSALQRAYDLALAMEARCYHGGEGRTRLRELAYTRLDYLALALGIIFLLAAIVTRLGAYYGAF